MSSSDTVVSEDVSEEVPFKPRHAGCGRGKCVPGRAHAKPLEQWDIWNEICPVSGRMG